MPQGQIADTIINMPPAQMAHIVKTLKTLPPELQSEGAQAINELKAHFASKIHDIGAESAQGNQLGQWNAGKVGQFLRQNNARMPLLFEPEEMRKFGSLNDAGNILKKDQRYPGAAVQATNMQRLFSPGVASGAGGALGATMAHLTGVSPAVGGIVGGTAASTTSGMMADRFLSNAAKSRIVKIETPK